MFKVLSELFVRGRQRGLEISDAEVANSKTGMKLIHNGAVCPHPPLASPPPGFSRSEKRESLLNV
jgi:hypothetical protein